MDSVCTVGKAREPGHLDFTLTGKGAGRSLTVSGGPFNEPMGLVACPPAGGLDAQASGAAASG